MNIKPLGFNATDVMEGIVAAAEAREGDWHVRPDANGVWWWHASELSYGCTRRAVLTRANYNIDPWPLKGRLTVLLGGIYHEQVERAWPHILAKTGGKAKLVHVEQGFYHKDIPLAAKPDAVLDVDGRIVAFEVKTEHEYAAERRANESRETGRYTAAKAEHMLQLAAQAEVLESNGVGPVEQGAVFYVSKNNMWLDIQPVDLTDQLLRREVHRIVQGYEAAWAAFEQALNGGQIVLPPRLPGATNPKPPWQCRRTKQGGGEFCPCLSICMEPRMPA